MAVGVGVCMCVYVCACVCMSASVSYFYHFRIFFLLCRFLTKEIGVAAIPCSVFYTTERRHLASHLVRFCFCKMDDSLIEAGKRLLKLKSFVIH